MAARLTNAEFFTGQRYRLIFRVEEQGTVLHIPTRGAQLKPETPSASLTSRSHPHALNVGFESQRCRFDDLKSKAVARIT